MELRNVKVIFCEDIMSDDVSEFEYYDQVEQSVVSVFVFVFVGVYGCVGGVLMSVIIEIVLVGFMEFFVRMQVEINRILVEILRVFNGFGKLLILMLMFDFCLFSVYLFVVIGNFVKCIVCFDGKLCDVEVLEVFIDVVQVYKECVGVSDEYVLCGLLILLEGDVVVWWCGVCVNVYVWLDVVVCLCVMYGMQLLLYKVL